MMEERTARRMVEATLLERGFSRDSTEVDSYEGKIHVHGVPYRIRISIPSTLFSVLPVVKLLDGPNQESLQRAHCQSGGEICYASSVGLPLDIYSPGASVLRVLEEVRRTLELSTKRNRGTEFSSEYQAYWKGGFVRSLLRPSVPGTTTEVSFFVAEKSGNEPFLALADRAHLRGYNTKRISDARIWFLDRELHPIGQIIIPSSLSDFEKWFCNNPALGPGKWLKALDFLLGRKAIFFSAPNAFVGVQLKLQSDLLAIFKKKGANRRNLQRILKIRENTVSMEIFSVLRCDIERVTKRNNGSMKGFHGVSIALIGCGTIGSHLARMLVQSGAGCDAVLSLYDQEILSEGNIGRHLLAFEHIGKPKATALQAELERFHPHVRVEAHSVDALTHWNRLQTHDLIIDATGEWNVQCALNEKYLNAEGSRVRAVLHCWVAMNGVAAQSFLNIRDENACFRCLVHNAAGDWRYPAWNRDDELHIVAASCSDGDYIPFSVDASIMAASLANRAALDWINESPGFRLRTLSVDLKRARYQGPTSPEPLKGCPACASLRVSKNETSSFS